jgi:hypothetical protein
MQAAAHNTVDGKAVVSLSVKSFSGVAVEKLETHHRPGVWMIPFGTLDLKRRPKEKPFLPP